MYPPGLHIIFVCLFMRTLVILCLPLYYHYFGPVCLWSSPTGEERKPPWFHHLHPSKTLEPQGYRQPTQILFPHPLFTFFHPPTFSGRVCWASLRWRFLVTRNLLHGILRSTFSVTDCSTDMWKLPSTLLISSVSFLLSSWLQVWIFMCQLGSVITSIMNIC